MHSVGKTIIMRCIRIVHLYNVHAHVPFGECPSDRAERMTCVTVQACLLRRPKHIQSSIYGCVLCTRLGLGDNEYSYLYCTMLHRPRTVPGMSCFSMHSQHVVLGLSLPKMPSHRYLYLYGLALVGALLLAKADQSIPLACIAETGVPADAVPVLVTFPATTDFDRASACAVSPFTDSGSADYARVTISRNQACSELDADGPSDYLWKRGVAVRLFHQHRVRLHVHLFFHVGAFGLGGPRRECHRTAIL